jgi:hypothetical protein
MLLLSPGSVMAFFLHFASVFTLFLALRSTSLSFSQASGLRSRDLSCSHTIWLCFLFPQPRCAIRGHIQLQPVKAHSILGNSGFSRTDVPSSQYRGLLRPPTPIAPQHDPRLQPSSDRPQRHWPGHLGSYHLCRADFFPPFPPPWQEPLCS